MLSLFYGSLVFAYILFKYSAIACSREINENYDKPFTVIVPVFNEKPELFRECIESILAADGKKEVMIVDDGSTKQSTIKNINKYINTATVIRQENKGKRVAQSKGVIYSQHDIIVTVDSDTIVKKDAFIELIKPFRYKNVGAVTGQVIVKNKNENLLTRLINAMYWSSFNIDRKSAGGLGYMQVCSGALSAYRKDLFLQLMHRYINQKFLGVKCTIGDDRFLTMRIQTIFKKLVTYQSKAISYTYSPSSINGFSKQLIRWKKSVLRETLLMRLSRGNLILCTEVWFNFIMSFISTGIIISFLLGFITGTAGIVSFLMAILYMSATFNLLMLFESRKNFVYRMGYSVLYCCIFWITLPISILKIREQGVWSTR